MISACQSLPGTSAGDLGSTPSRGEPYFFFASGSGTDEDFFGGCVGRVELAVGYCVSRTYGLREHINYFGVVAL